MFATRMKKFGLVMSRTVMENVLHEVISLGCIEAVDPDEFLTDKDLKKLVTRETIELKQYGANLDSIVLTGTHYTLLLAGWMTARSEPELTARLAEYMCAWELESPSPDETDRIPRKWAGPGFLSFLFKTGGRPFQPLAATVSKIVPADGGFEGSLSDR